MASTVEQARSQIISYEELPVFVAAGVVFAIWLPFQDPINIPKFALITLGTFIGLPLLKSALCRKFAVILVLLGLFASVLIFQSIFDSDNYRAIIGAYGRNTGSLVYICMAIMFAISLRYIKVREHNLILYFMTGTGLILGVYGYLQYLQIDPINWVNPFSTIVLTLGNPNFASAFLAMSASATLWLAFRSQQLFVLRSVYLATSMILSILIYLSNSQQGFLILAANISILGLVKMSGKNKKWVGLYLVFVTSVGMLGLLGMLQKGPLAAWLYQPSISFRGDYWRAAINMFRDNIFFGVGLDNFGENYTKYRDVTQVVNSGPETIADSAHNVFLQMAATGGISLLATYFMIQIYVLWNGIKILQNNWHGKASYSECAIFALWVGFQTQSLISVENLGIISFGWILGGTVCGISISKQVAQSRSSGRNTGKIRVQAASKVLLFTLSLVTTVLWTILMSRISSADTHLQKAKYLVIDETSDQEAAVKAGMLVETLKKNPAEKSYAIQITSELVKLRYVEEAKTRLENAFKEHNYPRKALYVLGEIAIIENNSENLIKIRTEIVKRDPLNYVNNFALVQLLVKNGKRNEAKKLFDITKKYAKSFPEYQKALNALQGKMYG